MSTRIFFVYKQQKSVMEAQAQVEKVVCIDTGRYCESPYYGKCVHTVKMIHENGLWTNVGKMDKEEIAVLHGSHRLDLPDHFK